MVTQFWLRFENFVAKKLSHAIVKKLIMLASASLVVNLALTLVGYQLNVFTLFGSLGLYFVYEEVLHDIQIIARSHKK